MLWWETKGVYTLSPNHVRGCHVVAGGAINRVG
jgi:hypothetical protein